MDYRDIPQTFEKAFDAFVSIEMLEHVGAQVGISFDHFGIPLTVNSSALCYLFRTCRLRTKTT